MKIKFVLTSLLLLSFLVCCGQEKKSDYVPVTKFDPARDAFKDLDDAIKEATDFDKRIILDVGGDWCPWCHILDAFIEEQNEIFEMFKRTDANTNLMHEGFNVDDPNKYSRPWFSWANSMFAEFILHINNKKIKQ